MQKHFFSRLHVLTSTKGQLEPCINEGLKFNDDKRLKRDIDTYLHNTYIKLYLYSNFRVANKLISSS